MKHLAPALLLLPLTVSLRAEDSAGASVARLDASAAIALAETIPLLAVNLNNYKHPANPVLAAGEMGQWDENGIERVDLNGAWRFAIDPVRRGEQLPWRRISKFCKEGVLERP